jgi:hypothetical protein
MIALPSSEEPQDLADWVEASCLFVDQSLSRSQIELALSAEGLGESVIENIYTEINWRNRLATSYPLETQGTRFQVKQRWNQRVAYSYQLLLTILRDTGLSQNASIWPKLAKRFEQLSELAAREYLHGSTMNIGFPRSTPIPTGFERCLDHLSNQLGENPIKPEHIAYSAPTWKDGGADVVAWVPFEDRQPSQVILLVACAAGRDWKEKILELDLKYWSKIIDWHVPPLQAFSIPFVFGRDHAWRGLSTQAGVIFDRLRIASLVESSMETTEKTRLILDLEEICKNLITKLPPWD